MKIAELFEEVELSQDEANEALELLVRMLPKQTEPMLVKMSNMNHWYVKGHLGPTNDKREKLAADKRWYRLEYLNGQWHLMTTTPDGRQLSSYFPDSRVEKAVDTIKSLYADWKKHEDR